MIGYGREMKGCEGEPIAAALVFMIWHIDGDPAVRSRIFMIDGIIFVILAVYSVVWCRTRHKRKLFAPIPIHEVMVMENPLYLMARKNQHKD